MSLIGRSGPRSVVLSIPAGPQSLGAAIVRKRIAQGVDDLHSVHAASPGVQNLSIIGPLNPLGLGDTPSRRRIFVCTPRAPDEERSCAQEILRALASRAFRRPVEASDASLETLLGFYDEGRARRDFDAGIQAALARMLVDPQFIYRFEEEPEGVPERRYRLSDLEIASRLSFFLWSSIPDDELLRAAAAHELTDGAELERQVRRMLADPRADALVDNFAGQWLMLRQLETVSPATPEFDGNLRAAMRRETQLLFESVLRETAALSICSMRTTRSWTSASHGTMASRTSAAVGSGELRSRDARGEGCSVMAAF